MGFVVGGKGAGGQKLMECLFCTLRNQARITCDRAQVSYIPILNSTGNRNETVSRSTLARHKIYLRFPDTLYIFHSTGDKYSNTHTHAHTRVYKIRVCVGAHGRHRDAVSYRLITTGKVGRVAS